MRLLKKIAPFAISALMLGATLGSAAALNIADWKTQFKSTNTAVVVGTGVTDTGDMNAALTLAKAVGIDTSATSSTITGEVWYAEKTSNKFNFGNNFTDISTSIDDDQLPTLLARGTFSDANSAEFDYTQKLTFATGKQLTYFKDSSYDDNEPTLGFHNAANAAVLNYTLDFVSNPDWDDGDLETATIDIMGRPYYISDVVEATSAMTLLDASDTQTIEEGGSATIGGKVVKVDFIDSTSKVKLIVDGVTTGSLSEGAVYNLGGGKYVGVKDVMYVAKDTGISKVELTFGNGKIDLVNGEVVEVNDDDIDDLTAYITNTTTLSTIVLVWTPDDENFITTTDGITLPGFETIDLGITELVFPKEENIKIAGSSETLELTVPITSGEAKIPLIYLNSSYPTYYIGTGEEAGKALETSTTSFLVFNESQDDEGFIASWVSGEDSETYYLKADVYQSDDVNYTKVKDLVTGEWVCEDVEPDDTCDVSGNLALTVNRVNYTADDRAVNFTAGSGVNFYKIYTKEGLLIYAPHSTSGTVGYLNTSAGSNLTTYVLYMNEEDKDGTLANGKWLNVTVGASSNNKTTVSSLSSQWLGNNYLELESDDDTYVGYVLSDLATKILWDTSADEDWATVTYHGEEAYGKVYVASTSSSSGGGSTSWTPVSDSDAALYTGKNIVVIGGTAVNKVARKMLDLDEATPVFGTEDGWATNTGVGENEAILWMKANPYGTAGKYALLVAGWSGTDTDKAANYLTLAGKGDKVAQEKFVINTITNEESA